MKNTIIIFTLFIIFISVLQAEDSIKVQSGWNNIGAISTKALSQITSVPPGIITSYYFGYTPTGYVAADTLKKGAGYWVKTTQAGVLKWGSSPASPCEGTPTVTYGGKTYTTVEIGSQCWLKENIDVGTMIQGTDTAKNNGIIEKYCYDNNAGNCVTYGGFYQWDEAMQYVTTRGTQGICPTGWHIPTYGELSTLYDIVNHDGNALKAVGQGTGGGAGTNTSGFSALLSGYRGNNGYFNTIGGYTYFWSSSQYDATHASNVDLYSNGSGIYFYHDNKEDGFSVRCLQD